MDRTFSPAKPQDITLSDGRVLSFGVFGAGQNEEPGQQQHPVVFHFHGTPSSHNEGYLMHHAALERGLQIISLDRPGFAGSSLQPGRRLLDWPTDVLAIADHFSIASFAVLGVSGGGPYALACIKAIPKARLAGVAIVSGLYPASLGLSGMNILNRLLLYITPWIPSPIAWAVELTQSRAARDEEHPEVFRDKMTELMKNAMPRDREIFSQNLGGYRDAAIASSRDALKSGGHAFAQEFVLISGDWGFKLEDLQDNTDEGRLVMWHGTGDVSVPFSMAEKASELLPNAELRPVEGEGHAGPILRGDEILNVIKGMLTRVEN